MTETKKAGTRRRRVVVDLSRLRLPGPGASAAWASDPIVRERERQAAIQQLRDCGLTEEAVQVLLARLRREHTTNEIVSAWPTVGEDRAVLEAAATLAAALSTILKDASPRAQAEIETAALLGALGPARTASEIGSDLRRLAVSIDVRARMLPPQSRRQSRAGIVRALVESAGPLLPAPTTWQESRFYIACCAAFVLAGWPGSPDKAIQRYTEEAASR